MIRVGLTIGFLVGLAPTASTGEVPYGADSIPYLARAARQIIRTAKQETEQLAVGRRAMIYNITAVDVLKGDMAAGQTVRIAVQGSLEGPAGLHDRLIFLGAPLGPRMARTLGVPDFESAFLVLSGTKGIIAARGERPAAVKDYLATLRLEAPEERAAARYTWAVKYLDTPDDALLQYSSILEGTRNIAEDRQAILFSRMALNASHVSPTNKGLVIRELQTSESPEAGEVLLEAARNSNAPMALKRQMLVAMTRVPTGKEMLVDLSQSEHALAPAARMILADPSIRSTAPVIDSVPDEKQLAAVAMLLDSKELSDRVRGLHRTNQLSLAEAKRFRSSVQKIASDTSAGDGERQVAVGVLASIGRDRKDVAELLRAIAANRKEPRLIRSAAILGLGKMNAEIKAQSFKHLLEQLDEKDPVDASLRRLARP